MRHAVAVMILLASTATAFAADAPAADAKGGKPGTNVDMSYLMAPMNGADGKLNGYAYISSRLTATSECFARAVRNKIAFIQDAFVRDVNGRGVSKPDDMTAAPKPGYRHF